MDIGAVMLSGAGSRKQHRSASASSCSSSLASQRSTETTFSSCFRAPGSSTAQQKQLPSLWSSCHGDRDGGHGSHMFGSSRTTTAMASASMEPVASGANHHSHGASSQGGSAAYFHWPPSSRLHGTAEERASYFIGLQKDLHEDVQPPCAISETETETLTSVYVQQQASTLLDLMTIRAFHSKLLRQFSLGTAIGFRTRNGVLTDIPAIIVFVARKVHKEWLHELQWLPPVLEGPGGIWCDVDVVEFSYYGTPAVAPKEQVYTELVEGLRGNYAVIGPGSQVASQETYGTLGAIVQSKTGLRQVGFLTNRHVAVDLNYPSQKMFHPLPPNLGPGVYLGSVERATSFITDDLWYGIFASMNPETFVRADGAFIPFGDGFDKTRVTTAAEGVGEMGDVMLVDLQAPVGSIVGKPVVKVGRSSGLTMGSIIAYALEYNDEKGICFFTDFLIVGENKQAFDLEGDSGSLILITEAGQKPRPVGIIWGGTANRGRLRLQNGNEPENWTSGVDLGRLLDLLQLSLITSSMGLAVAAEEQRRRTAELMGADEGQEASMRGHGKDDILDNDEGETCPPPKDMSGEIISSLDQQTLPVKPPIRTLILDPDDTGHATKEMQLLDFGFAPRHDEVDEKEVSFGFHLFNRDAKKRRPEET